MTIRKLSGPVPAPRVPARFLRATAAVWWMAAFCLSAAPGTPAAPEVSEAPGVSARRPAPERPTGDARRGKTVYEGNCVPCHGKDGAGGVKVTPTGNPSRSFSEAGFWRGRSDEQLEKAIEAGSPKSGMVAWRDVLKPQQIRDVVAYMRARFRPAGGDGRPAHRAGSDGPRRERSQPDRKK